MFSQENCPTQTIEMGGTIIDYCGEPSDIFSVPELPNCGPWTSYSTVEFTTDGTPYNIEIASNANYIDFPNTPINHQDILILDACNGNLVATTFQLACSYGNVYCGENTNQPLYNATFCLPAGTYIAVIGYLDPIYTIFLPGGLEIDYYEPQQGCITYTFGYPTFLELIEENEVIEITEENVFNKPKRYMHPIYGLLVILPDGRSVDMMGRQITTYGVDFE